MTMTGVSGPGPQGRARSNDHHQKPFSDRALAAEAGSKTAPASRQADTQGHRNTRH
jgi:hypothetical protein